MKTSAKSPANPSGGQARMAERGRHSRSLDGTGRGRSAASGFLASVKLVACSGRFFRFEHAAFGGQLRRPQQNIEQTRALEIVQSANRDEPGWRPVARRSAGSDQSKRIRPRRDRQTGWSCSWFKRS